MFYDQFGLLKPYQIALVSVGVAVLLLGVWVVSLIKPSGGGVEVGTWVEDDESDTSECGDLEPSESTTLLGGQTVSEPSDDDAISPQPHPQPGQPDCPGSPLSPRSGYSSRMSMSGMSSPTRRKSRGPRYGTLIPELAGHQLSPAGFSIGLGAASPGFVLRSEHPAHGHGSGSGHAHSHRRYRTQSEGQAGIMEIMRRSSMVVESGEAGQVRGRGGRNSDVEETLRRWDTEEERRRTSWWRSFLGSGQGEGRVRLDSESNAGGAGGVGDGRGDAD